MRSDLLDRYLAEHGLALIWIVYGERQRLAAGGGDSDYKQYKQLYWRANGKVKDL
jgi:hypothetical protein